MSIFDDYLPWTQQRLALSDDVDLTNYFLPAINVTQDQRIPITNLMTILYPKIKRSVDLSKTKNRFALVQWYESLGKKTFRIEELELLLKNKESEGASKLEQSGINLVGYARSMSGLGDDIRGLIIVLDRLCIPYSVVCLGHPSDHLMYGRVPNEVLKPVYASSIFCMNGFEFCKLSDIYKNLSDNYGYIVLQAPWELPKLVAKWGPKLEVVDKIWAISKFVETAFTSADFDNVVYNPPIVDVFTPSISNKIRRQKRPFTFLYVFDAASYLSRKNPQAAVQCFQKAFQSDENVCLILKVSNAESSAEFAELERKCLSDKRIHVKRQSLKPEQIVKMINQCSCYLSLHRSEGFGRTIAQASLLAKPVIATNWSGSTDILPDNCRLNVAYTLIAVKEGEYPGFEQQHWAEPDEAVAIEKMKEIYFATDALRLKTGLENQKFAQERFTPEASVERYHEQFKYIMGHTEDQ